MKAPRRLLCSGLIAALLSAGAWAESTPPEQSGFDMSQVVSMMGKMPTPPSGEGGKLPDFDKVTEGMESKEGLFTLWYYPDGAKDKDPEKLLAQIPASFLGEKFMLSTSFSGGGFFTGFPLDERVVMWELLDDQLVLVEPETRYVRKSGEAVDDVVGRTYPDRIRVAVPVVTKSPSGDPVIDFGKLLKSEFADIGWMTQAFSSMFGMGGGGNINSGLSKWTKKKTFPLNVEMGVELAVSRSSPPGSYDKKLVHYSFWKLPKSDYKPRIADDRIGYFLTTNQDWTTPTEARDTFNRYIDRWHLVKRDPSLKLCQPVKPIVFYVEKTVPVKFRRAVRDGILEWNKAFEDIGFVNAIEVRQQENDNEFADIDPEDMRYSFFRWVVNGAGFAMGPHRANPFTGEIYDADIIFDDAMVRYMEQSARRMLPSALAHQKLSDPALQGFLAENPQWKRPTRDWEQIELGEESKKRDLLRTAMQKRLGHKRYNCCEYAEGMMQQMAFGHSMLAEQPPEVIDQFLYDIIKEIVTHEVGHTLGLRHNFKASSIWTIDEIKKRKAAGEATTGSVMDYNPVLFFADNPTEGNFVTPTIGPYDYWAIEYGYRPFDGSYKGPEEEKAEESTETAEAEEQPTQTAEEEVVVAGKIDLDSIPKEVLDQMPPEVKKMIASGELSTMMQKAHGGGSKSIKRGKPSGPSFASAPSGEEAMLQKIASRGTEPLLAYATDEDTTSMAPDPLVNRFDCGQDALGWAKTRAELVEKRMANLLDWAVKDDESWYHLRQTYLTLLFEKLRTIDFVGRYIGGQYFNRDHRGDPNARPPFELVSADDQREALAYLEDTVFTDDFFVTDAKVLNHLAPSRWWHDGTSVSFTMDYPVHDMIGTMQWYVLFDRLFPNNIRRIHDAELKTNGSDRFTASEYIQRLQKACWAETCNAKRAKSGTWTDLEPFVSDVRRSLQREYLGLIEPMIRQQPGRVLSPDLHAMLEYSLRQISEDLGEVMEAGTVDFASQAHLYACKSRIDRMLSAELEEQSPYGGTIIMMGHEPGAIAPQ